VAEDEADELSAAVRVLVGLAPAAAATAEPVAVAVPGTTWVEAAAEVLAEPVGDAEEAASGPAEEEPVAEGLELGGTAAVDAAVAVGRLQADWEGVSADEPLPGGDAPAGLPDPELGERGALNRGARGGGCRWQRRRGGG
jgi:hypothetical protein